MRTLSRRRFLAATAVAGAAAATGTQLHRYASCDFLSEAQASTLAALCDEIIPADDFPSASAAGVVTYIDRQLMRHYRRHRKTYENGLAEADRLSRQRAGVALSDASPSVRQEVATLLSQQQRAFFELLRAHTMEGYYGSPRHGGNRDAVSWRMLGLAEPPLRGRAQFDFTRGPAS